MKLPFFLGGKPPSPEQPNQGRIDPSLDGSSGGINIGDLNVRDPEEITAEAKASIAVTTQGIDTLLTTNPIQEELITNPTEGIERPDPKDIDTSLGMHNVVDGITGKLTIPPAPLVNLDAVAEGFSAGDRVTTALKTTFEPPNSVINNTDGSVTLKTTHPLIPQDRTSPKEVASSITPAKTIEEVGGDETITGFDNTVPGGLQYTPGTLPEDTPTQGGEVLLTNEILKSDKKQGSAVAHLAEYEGELIKKLANEGLNIPTDVDLGVPSTSLDDKTIPGENVIAPTGDPFRIEALHSTPRDTMTIDPKTGALVGRTFEKPSPRTPEIPPEVIQENPPKQARPGKLRSAFGSFVRLIGIKPKENFATDNNPLGLNALKAHTKAMKPHLGYAVTIETGNDTTKPKKQVLRSPKMPKWVFIEEKEPSPQGQPESVPSKNEGSPLFKRFKDRLVRKNTALDEKLSGNFKKFVAKMSTAAVASVLAVPAVITKGLVGSALEYGEISFKKKAVLATGLIAASVLIGPAAAPAYAVIGGTLRGLAGIAIYKAYVSRVDKALLESGSKEKADRWDKATGALLGSLTAIVLPKMFTELGQVISPFIEPAVSTMGETVKDLTDRFTSIFNSPDTVPIEHSSGITSAPTIPEPPQAPSGSPDISPDTSTPVSPEVAPYPLEVIPHNGEGLSNILARPELFPELKDLSGDQMRNAIGNILNNITPELREALKLPEDLHLREGVSLPLKELHEIIKDVRINGMTIIERALQENAA